MKRSWDVRFALALLTLAGLPLQVAMAADTPEAAHSFARSPARPSDTSIAALA